MLLMSAPMHPPAAAAGVHPLVHPRPMLLLLLLLLLL
jgi:hypothetical protein